MKVVILAGGTGTRLSEETEVKPKPMVNIGNKPILWHIMKIYSYYGFNDFIICLGYKGYIIKEYFVNYYRHEADLTIDLSDNSISVHNSIAEPWKVTLVDTGTDTMTGGRIKRIQSYIGTESFMLTYGDGLADINIKDLIQFHNDTKQFLTVTAVQPLGRFGSLNIIDEYEVNSFLEKPKRDGNYINGGFFVCEPEIFDYIAGDDTIFEKEPLERLAEEGHMVAYKHDGFWKPMDTLRDKIELIKLWNSEEAPWKIW